MPSDHAKLFIPSGVEGTDSLTWRLALLKKEKFFSIDQIKQTVIDFNKSSNKKLSPRDKYRWFSTACKPAFQINEIDITFLFVTTLMLNADKLPDITIAHIDPHIRQYMIFEKSNEKKFIAAHPEVIKDRREVYLYLGQIHLKNQIQNIRAKLAFLEIAAYIDPDRMIPFLVNICPKYLGCNYVQHWIQANKSLSLYGDKVETKLAQTRLTALAKSITGDKRKVISREYNYWSTDRYFDDLLGWIIGFREAHAEKNFDMSFFNQFCTIRKIPDNYQKQILSSDYPVINLVLEIMSAQKIIKSPKTFYDFKPKIGKYKKMYDSSIISYLVQDFLDFPTRRPKIISELDYWSVLEKVEF